MEKIDEAHLDYKEVLRGSHDYILNEKRDAIYKVASSLVSKSWFNSTDIADGIGVLLLVWNQAYYRYCNFDLDFDSLEDFLARNARVLKDFRDREINSLTEQDEKAIDDLFNDLLNVLKCGDRKSPVAVSKALHLLAPGFFPLWDDDIAKAYRCYWEYSEYASEKYLKFMRKIRLLSQRIILTYSEGKIDQITAKREFTEKVSANLPFVKSMVKILDEYNYAFTKYWHKSSK